VKRLTVARFIAPQCVADVSHLSARMAPTIVKLAPQFIGRGSTRTSPRGSHASGPSPDWPRFIEKNHPSWVYPADPTPERAALGLDRGPIQFRGPRPFFKHEARAL
jgi:hypothetical protein